MSLHRRVIDNYVLSQIILVIFGNGGILDLLLI